MFPFLSLQITFIDFKVRLDETCILHDVRTQRPGAVHQCKLLEILFLFMEFDFQVFGHAIDGLFRSAREFFLSVAILYLDDNIVSILTFLKNDIWEK